MKLIYIANARIPTERAHGIQIMKMCEAFVDLKSEGKKVGMELALPIRANNIKIDPFVFYNVKKNFKITYLPSLDLFRQLKYLDKLSLLTQILTFYLSALFYLLFKKFDLIYTRDEYAFLFLPWRKKMIWEAHNLPKSFKFIKKFVSKLKLIVAISNGLKNRLVEEGFNSDKIIVAPDGVDLQMFDIKVSRDEARNKLDLPLDKKIILYTGHLYLWKGVQTLVEASKYLSDDCLVIFLGGIKEDIEKFKSKIQNLKSNIQIVGYRPHAEIPYWLKAADVLVLPNSGKEQISREFTSPMKLFEYMASGTPIVASRLPSIMEILEDRKNAVLFEADNPKDLAGKIEEVLNNQELADKIAGQAHQDVQNYSWDKRATKILEFITSR